MKVFRNLFQSVIDLEHLFSSWEEFNKGKWGKSDVRHFYGKLEEHIFDLHRELKRKTYRHGFYHGFTISDPKLRHIHKATVRDRVVHHALFSILNKVFEPTFIADSFSCRVGKGAHKGVDRVQSMIRKVSKNQSTRCYALKCDVKKFFDSVDHATLLTIITRRINDPDFMWLVEEIVASYSYPESRERERERESKRGVPIGNLTSQIFANIYMNEFDQFIKHELRVKNYARYTDDFVIIANSRSYLEKLLPSIEIFLDGHLGLSLHPKKVSIEPCHRGVDFLGYIIFPHHRFVRTRTRKRAFFKLRKRAQEYSDELRSEKSLYQVLHSYLGVFSHANTYKISRDLKNLLWFWMAG